MGRSHVKPFPQPPACEEYCAGEGEDIRPASQVEGQESDGRIVLRLSEAREGSKATGTEKQEQGNAHGPSDPITRPAALHHDSISPAYTDLRPVALASDVS